MKANFTYIHPNFRVKEVYTVKKRLERKLFMHKNVFTQS